jgi:hypothetical protein
MRGDIPTLLNTPSWSGAQLKKSTGTHLPLSLHDSLHATESVLRS